MQKHEGENQDMVLVSNSCQCVCVKVSKYLSLKLLKTQANMKQLVTSVGIIFNDSSWRSGITCASLKPNSKDWVMQLRKAFKHFLQLGKGWESYQTENQERAQDALGINNTFVELVTILLFFQHDSRSVWELPPAPRRGDAGDFFIVLDGWGYF